jgi:long-subunit fatty acid transport protein
MLAIVEPAIAQTNSFINSGVQFEFPPPGARSLALGGAFVAVADDATASVANPAGLTILARPEISIEGRFWNFSAVSPLRGRYSGTPTNVGYDNIPDLVQEESEENRTGVSFLSAVIPRGRFALAFYRHEQSRYRASFTSDGIFNFDQGLVNTTEGAGQDRLDPYTAQLSLDVVNYGVSAAYRFAGGLAVGGGVAISDFSIDGTTNVFYLGLNPNAIPPAQRNQHTAVGLGFGPPDFSESGRQARVTELGDDIGLGLNFGALYRPPTGKWAVGAAFRLAPKFEYDAEARWGPVQDRFAGPPSNGDLLDSDHVEFKFPDTYSFGLSYRPGDRLLFAGQYDRVQYSQLSENTQDVFATAEPVKTEFTEGLSHPDSNQVRFGTEYVVSIAPHVVSLRMGVAFESDHQMRYTQVGSVRYPRLEILYPAGEDQWHFTPGLGVAFEKFQIDGAFDVADLSRTLSVSAVYRF